MRTIQINGGILDNASLRLCVDALRKSEILCYPTETLYALGIDLWDEDALHKLYALKNRPPEKQLALIASDISMVATVCDTGDSRFAALAMRFWPGPLTIALPSTDRSTSFAIRVSSHPVARQIVEAFGSPLVSTSANLTGEPAVSDPQSLSEQITAGVSILVDGGILAGGAPSTIVSLVERPGKILREGAIPAAEIVSLL
ncbi:threonylcarbamoyl-AMP synthase [bacterium]|nr:threonylcarbamoyl-AMP synthase [bacterium]MCI0604131.1 threonylcarbamoyl-AMP synthase [bacterium]